MTNTADYFHSMKDTMNKSENRSYIYQVKLDASQKNDARIIAGNFIEPDSLVLDVGCACGDFGEFIKKEKKCQIYGMEYDDLSIKEAYKKNVFEAIHQVDLNSFDNKKFTEYNNRFDYVALIDVLEHTLDPRNSILKLKPFLKNGGEMVFSLPNISFGDIKISILRNDFTYTDMGILDKTHIRFFTHRTIAELISECGMEILECRAKVGSIKAEENGLPEVISEFISNDPHSHVYQYIFKAVDTSLPADVLIQKNYAVMDLDYDNIKFQIDSVKRQELINKILPLKSRRRAIIKKIISLLKRG